MTQYVERYYIHLSFCRLLVWDLGNGLNATGDTISFVYDNAGQYDITLFAYNNSSGCSDTVQGNSTLVVLPAPVADFLLITV